MSRNDTPPKRVLGALPWGVLAVASVLTCLVFITTQDQELSAGVVVWTVAFSLPLMVLARRGHVGTQSLQYPTATFAVQALWLALMGPSLLGVSDNARLLFVYGDEAEFGGKLFFVTWTLLMAIMAPTVGSSKPGAQHQIPESAYAVLLAVFAVSFVIVASSGQLSHYSPVESRAAVADGGAVSVARTIYLRVGMLGPSVALLYGRGTASRSRIAIAWTVAVGTVFLLVIAGGRREVVLAVAMGMVMARRQGLTPRWRTVSTGAVLGAVLMVVMFAHRMTMASQADSNFTSVVGALFDVGAKAAEDEEFVRLVTNESNENVSTRLWYAPQFFAAFDQAMVHGASLSGSFLEGIILTMPSLLMPEKNELSVRYALEPFLLNTGRFPNVDLSPSPWLQWAFEFGIYAGLLGALFYGLLLRWADEPGVPSLSEWLIVGSIITTIASVEHQTDGLVLAVRDAAVVAAPIFFLERRDRLKPTPQEIAKTLRRVPVGELP